MSRYGQRTLTGNNREISGVGKKPPAGIGVVQGYGVATGGTSSSITVSSESYTLLTFTSDGTLTVATAGLFDCVLIGGGGSGGSSNDSGTVAGGGGGGGVTGIGTTCTIFIPAGSHTIDVGAGAAANSGVITSNKNGQQSVIGSIISVPGGGSGGSQDNPRGGIPGGCGGGSRGHDSPGGEQNGGFGFAAGGSVSGGGGGGAGGSPSGQTGGVGLSLSTFTGGTNTTVVSPGGNGNSTNTASIVGAGGAGSPASANNGRAGAAGAVLVRFKV